MPDSLLYDKAKNDTTLLRQIIQNRPGEIISANAQNRIGIIYYNAKLDNIAETEFLNVYNHYQGQREVARASLYLGKIAFHNGKYDESTIYFTQFLKSQPSEKEAADAHYHMGIILYYSNKEDQAEQEFLNVQKNYPNQPESKKSSYQLGKISFHKGNYDEASKYIANYLATNPKEKEAADMHYHLGMILYNTNKEDQAEQEFQNIKNNYPNQPVSKRVSLHLGKISFHKGNYDKATNYLNEFIGSNPDSDEAIDAQFHLALTSYKSNKTDLAEQMFLSLYNQHPNKPESSEAGSYLGNIAISKNNYQSAKKYLTEYLITHPDGKSAEFAKYHILKAKYQSNDTDYIAFAHGFLSEKHDSIKSGNASIQYDLVWHLINNHKYEQALTEANLMVSNYPDYHAIMQVRFQIGQILSVLNKSQEALTQYNSILQILNISSKDAARALYETGGVYENLNDFENAKANFKLVQSQYPQETQMFIISEYSLAMLTYQQYLSHPDSSNLVEGCSKLRNFVTAYPTDHHTPRALHAMADLLTSSKRYSEALDAYDKIIGFDSTLIPINQRQDIKYNERGAHRSLVKEVMLSKAKIMRQNLKRSSDAMAIYNGMLTTDQNNCELLINKALCHIDLGQKTEAKALLTQVVQSGGKEKTRASHILEKLQ